MVNGVGGSKQPKLMKVLPLNAKIFTMATPDDLITLAGIQEVAIAPI